MFIATINSPQGSGRSVPECGPGAVPSWPGTPFEPKLSKMFTCISFPAGLGRQEIQTNITKPTQHSPKDRQSENLRGTAANAARQGFSNALFLLSHSSGMVGFSCMAEYCVFSEICIVICLTEKQGFPILKGKGPGLIQE